MFDSVLCPVLRAQMSDCLWPVVWWEVCRTQAFAAPGEISAHRARQVEGVLSWELNKEQSTGIAQEPGWKAAQTLSNDPDGVFILVY